MSEPTYPQGTMVKFKGGLGRNEREDDFDPDAIHSGIVNGPVYLVTGGAYVPVHVTEANHNMLVFTANIVEVAR